MKRTVQSVLVGIGVFVAVVESVFIVGGVMLSRATPMSANGIQVGAPTDADLVMTMYYVGAAAGILLGLAAGVLYWRSKS